MLLFDSAKTTTLSEASIEEVEALAFSGFEGIGEQVALVESFRQPYPLRARDKSVMGGDMDSYG